LDPKVSVLDVSVNEADKKATITFTLDLLSGRDVSVEYATQDGTAEAPGDYTSTSGLVTIPAGTMSTAIDILIIDDLDEEDVETFTVRISNVTGGKIAVGGDIATVTVVDADPGPNLPYLFAVYIITWAGFFGYVFVMARRRGEVQREIEALRAALADQDRLPEQREQGSPAQ
jgi:CcmD family protein